jgi:hypothetical protein
VTVMLRLEMWIRLLRNVLVDVAVADNGHRCNTPCDAMPTTRFGEIFSWDIVVVVTKSRVRAIVS